MPADGPPLVAVGASAGGVEALTALAAGLPEDLPAAVLVVLHISPLGTSVLGQILDRAGPLPAKPAVHGERLEPARVYVAPPDHHLLVLDGHLELSRGPRENGHRPAVDPLLSSAARCCGSRIVAAVLSGTRDDGAVGMLDVHRAGGMTLVQDPETCLYPGMPQAALAAVPVARVAPIDQLGTVVADLVAQVISRPTPMAEPPHRHVPEAGHENSPSEFFISCPDCGGVLAEHRVGAALQFGCHVGHQYSPESLLSANGDRLEVSLWAAVRALEERAALSRRVAARIDEERLTLTSASLLRQAEEAEARALDIRRAIEAARAVATGE